MAFTLDKVVPWGRSYDEYVSMFALSPADLTRRILGCGDGPASFNAVLTMHGGKVVSIDPVYEFNAEDIRRRIEETSDEVIEQTHRNQHEFVWRKIKSIKHLRELRMTSMSDFLKDYPIGLQDRRYIVASLPVLPFDDNAFELALCSHYLFLYSEQISLEEHIASIREMCRVALEVRVFPLLELGTKPSRHLGAVLSALESQGYHVEVRPVDYEFQKGGNKMLVVNPSMFYPTTSTLTASMLSLATRARA